jgi:hypothetical protein
MKKTTIAALALPMAMLSVSALAYNIDDTSNGANSYWGSDPHGYGDVIQGSTETTYEIQGADVSVANHQLAIDIFTNFAGHAGADTWAESGTGIGYGDLFLSSSWTPYGTDAHHQADNASNGTTWAYGLVLDDRWNNTGGSFSLYQLDGTNAQDVLLSDNFLTCGLGSQCWYRNGQATAVNTGSGTVADTGITGTWTVDSNSHVLHFLLDIGDTSIDSWSNLALHWGMTCQNDAIEGLVTTTPHGQIPHVPEPATWSLLGMGYIVSRMRRRRG